MGTKINISLAPLCLMAVFLFNPPLYAQEEATLTADKEARAAQVTSSSENKYEENLKRWQSLSEEERQIIRERAARLSSEQKKALREESAKFKSMPKEEQDRVKANYQRFNKLAPGEKEILKEKFQRFQKFAPERKKELQRQFREKKAVPSGGLDKDSGLQTEKPAELKQGVPGQGPVSAQWPEYKKKIPLDDKGAAKTKPEYKKGDQFDPGSKSGASPKQKYWKDNLGPKAGSKPEKPLAPKGGSKAGGPKK